MNRRSFLTGMVMSAVGTELIVQASAAEVAQFGSTTEVVAAGREADGRKGVPFNLSDPIHFNRKGEPVAVAQDFRVIDNPAAPGQQALVILSIGTVPVSFGQALPQWSADDLDNLQIVVRKR